MGSCEVVPQAGVPQPSDINGLECQTVSSGGVGTKSLFDVVANQLGPPKNETAAPVASSDGGNQVLGNGTRQLYNDASLVNKADLFRAFPSRRVALTRFIDPGARTDQSAAYWNC
jgi:hypothetical protein